MRFLGGLGDGDAGFEAAERDVVAVVAVPAEALHRVDGERGDDLVVGKLTRDRGLVRARSIWGSRRPVGGRRRPGRGRRTIMTDLPITFASPLKRVCQSW